MKLVAWALEGLRRFSRQGWRADCTASFLGGVLKLFAPRRKMILSNLGLVYHDSPMKWRLDVRRRLYEHLGLMVTEIMTLQRDPSQALNWVDELHNRHYMDEAIARGKGMVFLSGHFGNWELLAAWYAQYLKKKDLSNFYIVSQNIKDRDINRLVERYRLNAGINLLPKYTSTLEMVKMLKAGAHIAALADISWLGGLSLPFMGQICTNSMGPAVLSVLASAPIVPVGIYRKEPFKHDIVFFPPLQAPDGRDRRLKIESLTLEVNKALEKMIAPRPELWFWLHNRWKKG